MSIFDSFFKIFGGSKEDVEIIRKQKEDTAKRNRELENAEFHVTKEFPDMESHNKYYDALKELKKKNPGSKDIDFVDPYAKNNEFRNIEDIINESNSYYDQENIDKPLGKLNVNDKYDNKDSRIFKYVQMDFNNYLKKEYGLSLNEFFNVKKETDLPASRDQIIDDFLNNYNFSNVLTKEYGKDYFKNLYQQNYSEKLKTYLSLKQPYDLESDKNLLEQYNEFNKNLYTNFQKQYIESLKNQLSNKLKGLNISDSSSDEIKKQQIVNKRNNYFVDNYNMSYDDILKLKDDDKINGLTKEDILQKYVIDTNPSYAIEKLKYIFEPKFDEYIKTKYEQGYYPFYPDVKEFNKIAEEFFKQKDIDQSLQEEVIKLNEGLPNNFKLNLNYVKKALTELFSLNYASRDKDLNKPLDLKYKNKFLGRGLDNVKGYSVKTNIAFFSKDFIDRNFDKMMNIVKTSVKNSKSQFIINDEVISRLRNYIDSTLKHYFDEALKEWNSNIYNDDSEKTYFNYFKNSFIHLPVIKKEYNINLGKRTIKRISRIYDTEKLDELRDEMTSTILKFFIPQLNQNVKDIKSEDLLVKINSLFTTKNKKNLFLFLWLCERLYLANANISNFEKYKKALEPLHINYENLINNVRTVYNNYISIKGKSLNELSNQDKKKFLDLVNSIYPNIYKDLNFVVQYLLDYGLFLEMQEDDLASLRL